MYGLTRINCISAPIKTFLHKKIKEKNALKETGIVTLIFTDGEKKVPS